MTEDERRLRDRTPFLWANPGWKAAAGCLDRLPVTRVDLEEAGERWRRFAPLLAELFPELKNAGGLVESPLLPVPSLGKRILPPDAGRVFVKADHALPVAGSVKARGGLYAVLHFAEKVALERRLLAGTGDDYRKLAAREARLVFGEYELSVGSTGNLGLSIGLAGAALGFRVAVHMSVEAREWKKERLRKLGVKVVEHASDYTAACGVARAEAAGDPRRHFIDDENSLELFLGYAVAALRLKAQLTAAVITVGPRTPLFLYLPCGVGGAPGGITFGTRHVFGDHAHCFFIEPVEAPCFLYGMMTGRHAAASVYELGLTLKTEADGLAVSRPSRFVGQLMEPLLSGCGTVADDALFRHLIEMFEAEKMEVEPSAAAGCAGPRLVLETEAGRDYLQAHDLIEALPSAVHVIWTTGGSLVPESMHEAFRRRA